MAELARKMRDVFAEITGVDAYRDHPIESVSAPRLLRRRLRGLRPPDAPDRQGAGPAGMGTAGLPRRDPPRDDGVLPRLVPAERSRVGGMDVLIFTLGSLGDIHPFVGLGRALASRGHRVTIGANSAFRELVLSAGLGHEEVGTRADLEATFADERFWHPYVGYRQVVERIILPAMRRQLEIVTEARAHPVPRGRRLYRELGGADRPRHAGRPAGRCPRAADGDVERAPVSRRGPAVARRSRAAGAQAMAVPASRSR